MDSMQSADERMAGRLASTVGLQGRERDHITRFPPPHGGDKAHWNVACSCRCSLDAQVRRNPPKQRPSWSRYARADSKHGGFFVYPSKHAGIDAKLHQLTGRGRMGDVLLDEHGEKRRIRQSERWLLKCRRLVKLERSMRELADAQFRMADGLKGIDYSRDNVQVSPTDDAIPNAVSRHMEVCEDLCQIADSITERRAQAVESLMDMENPVESAVLIDYYLCGLDWDDVADSNGYTVDGVMKVRRRALLHAYDVMPHIEREAVPAAL